MDSGQRLFNNFGMLFFLHNNYQNIQMQQSIQEDKDSNIISELEFNGGVGSSTLQIFNTSINHTNHAQIKKTHQHIKELNIINWLPNIHNGHLEKIIEIQLEDSIIRISDTFTPFNLPEFFGSQMNKIPIEKSLQQDKELSDDVNKTFKHDEVLKKKKSPGTKNVVKNIFRLFRSWIEEKSPIELLNTLKLSLNAIFETKGKFNNALIIQISKNQMLRQAFISFSDSQAPYLIDKSRIHDKKSHHEALNLYRELCKEKNKNEADSSQSNQEIESKNSNNILRQNQYDLILHSFPSQLERPIT